jgi:SAM-dependent methyltransferase
MVEVLAKLHRVLKPGGAILFRDYGEYDMAQLRFLSRKNPNKIDECMYVRWDGTTSYFFSLGTLRHPPPTRLLDPIALHARDAALARSSRAGWGTEELRELFGKAGFIEDENKFDIRELKNRKRKVRSSFFVHLPRSPGHMMSTQSSRSTALIQYMAPGSTLCEQIVMFRVWANSRFRKPLAGERPAACPPTGSASSSEQGTA